MLVPAHLVIRHLFLSELVIDLCMYRICGILSKLKISIDLIVLSFDRNLFNCGEGTFRLLHARGHRFRCLSNVFCTRNHWERVGGIPSVARAFFDRNKLFPTFHGPPQLNKCLHKFAELTDLDPELAVTDKQFNSKSYFEDRYMQVDSVVLNSTDAIMAKSNTVIAFVGRFIPRRGTIILSKFTENNIPIEFIRSINNGEDVTLPDGQTILAKDFLTKGFDGGNFLSEFFFFLSCAHTFKSVSDFCCA